MESALVSAVITTHNRAPSIVLRAVNSVLNQSYGNIELIVVDDSDSDYPQREEVEKEIAIASPIIRYIKHEECKGACAARNTGLSLSGGSYVAFLDDDDEWLYDKIEEQLKGFTDSNIALVYCGCLNIDEIQQQESERQVSFQRGYVLNALLKNNFIGGTSIPLIRKECVEAIGGFDIEMQSAQDFDVWVRISKKYQINYIDKLLVKHYIHKGERISSDLDKKIAGLERINSKYSESIDRDSDIWYARHMVLVPFYGRKGWEKKAWSTWFQCIQKRPRNIRENLRQLLFLVFCCERCRRLRCSVEDLMRK